MIKKFLILCLSIIIVITSGCTAPQATAESIVQQNSANIQEDLQAYGLEMNINELTQDYQDYC